MAGVTEKTNTKGAPRWCGDFLGRETLMPFPARVNPYAFSDKLGTLVKINNGAGYAAGVTSVVVDAIANAIPQEATIHMGGAKFIRLSAAAAAGATTLTVYATPTALVDNDEGYYSAAPGRIYIPSGTLIGRTLAERDANTAFGPAVDTDDEIFLTAFDVDDAVSEPDVELVRVYAGVTIKENYLPDWTAIAAAAGLLTDLRARYNCIKGVN